jgi:hypothetical protein
VVVVVDGVDGVVVVSALLPARHEVVAVADGAWKALLGSSPTDTGMEMTLSAPLTDEWA